ncbi:hypothetical protein [Pseudalkalibacillus caeni]|uniref:Uncharacterized protein n=1 Tax=Exobacillus caeni TaxID=2574798 RepID=A0A5R9EV70_9BACL|nr:hypothetical protein [Pseudalkalibacillus caeni]TLS34957.1 hypothetical protein FCL54_22885 [Pseudalkalibacillus caeni]
MLVCNIYWSPGGYVFIWSKLKRTVDAVLPFTIEVFAEWMEAKPDLGRFYRKMMPGKLVEGFIGHMVPYFDKNKLFKFL